jgi:phenylalanyl-tRNA synthetase alpha chain
MNELLKELQSAKTIQDLDNIKSKWLGKKSDLRAQMDAMRDLPADKRAARGAELNKLRESYENAIEDAKKTRQSAIINQQLQNDNFDMTLPGCGIMPGALHPVSVMEQKCIDAMRRLGFIVAHGPEIEEPMYNFDLLDIPPHHPARDLQDTFWINSPQGGGDGACSRDGGGKLLRTHTTSVQSRYMMDLKGDESKLPIRIVSPGRVYRNEAVDAWHGAMFHQFEGLMVGRDVRLSELKGTLEFILREVFGANVKIRFKPKFYPYTEPSVGADVFYEGKWITIAGAGMVSPQVLRNFGFNPARVSGFAFGFGTSRLASIFTGMNMRELYGMDMRVFKNLP